MAFRAAATNVALIDPASLSVPSASILAVGGAPRTTPAQVSIVPMNRATPLRKSARPPTVIQIGTRRNAPAMKCSLTSKVTNRGRVEHGWPGHRFRSRRERRRRPGELVRPAPIQLPARPGAAPSPAPAGCGQTSVGRRSGGRPSSLAAPPGRSVKNRRGGRTVKSRRISPRSTRPCAVADSFGWRAFGPPLQVLSMNPLATVGSVLMN